MRSWLGEDPFPRAEVEALCTELLSQLHDLALDEAAVLAFRLGSG